MTQSHEGPFRVRFSVELESYGCSGGPRSDIEKLRARVETMLRVRLHDHGIVVRLDGDDAERQVSTHS